VNTNYQSKHVVNIPALEKARGLALEMKKSSDRDINHSGSVIERLMMRVIEKRKKELEKLHTNEGSKKIFYTSAQASAIEDD
jgi:hypothetical protein